MWGPTALLMGKLEFFVLPLSYSGQFLCNSSLAHQAADLVSVSGGAKGIGGNHPWRLQRHDLPPTPISHTVQFLWQTTCRRRRGQHTGSMHYCTPIVSQPATLTHVKQVLQVPTTTSHGTIWCDCTHAQES